MWLDGVSSEEAIRINEERAAKIEKWLKNKNVKAYKRVLYRLYKYGAPMSTLDIASDIQGNKSSVWRTLRHLEVDSAVKSIKKRNRVTWMLKPRGEKEVRRMIKGKRIPNFWGVTY